MADTATLEITTSSEVIHWSTSAPHLPQGTPPTIKLDGTTIPPPETFYLPTGFQVLIFDTTKPLSDPSALIANNVSYVQPNPAGGDSWMDTYSWMFSGMRTTILNSGNIGQQMRVMVSFGLDNNMPPTPDMYELMLNSGAGSHLQNWETHCDAGSQVGNPTSWVSYPASYILVGASYWLYGEGFEKYLNEAGQLSLTVPVSQP